MSAFTPGTRNTLNQAGARRIVQIIKDYWTSKGHREPELRIQRASVQSPDFTVRSDMRNGMP